MRLVLASASPRRLELLERIGLSPEVMAAEVDETVLPDETAAEYVMRVAADKAHKVRTLSFPVGRVGAAPVVLAADTAVVLDGQTLGKPADREAAVATLRKLSGHIHEVLTAVVAIDASGIEHSVLSRAVVTFATISDDEVDWYVATGEPFDKAGSYAIQGVGGVLVERIEGDPSTVIGLPLRATVELLRISGFGWPGPG